MNRAGVNGADTAKKPETGSSGKHRAFLRTAWRGFVPDAQTLLTGCGFALAFGWLWFPVLRNMLLPDVVAGSPGFQLLVFSLAGAVPGVWWTARLLALGPGKAVSALAVAAAIATFVALVPAWALSLLSYPASGGPGFVLCAIAAGNALAVAAEAALRQLEKRKALQIGALPDAPMPPVMDSPKSPSFLKLAWLWPLGIIAIVFFGLGSLNVLTPATGISSAMAQVCGLALVAVFVNAKPETTSAISGLTGLPYRAIGLAACALGVLTLITVMSFSGRTALTLLADALQALPEAAALAVCTAMHANRNETQKDTSLGRRGAVFLASLFLVLTLAAVNGGYLAGLKLASLAGKPGPALLGLAAALPLAVAAYQKRKRANQPEVSLCPAISGQLTEREQALALLLVRGYSNKAIAEALELTENTVRWHIKNLNKKTGAEDRARLIAALTAKHPAPGAPVR